MKIKKKGKVHPSPSSSSSSTSASSSSLFLGANGDGDVLSVFKLLPAAILALVSILSLEDREVLAYMITRSMKTTTTTNPSSFVQESKKKASKKPPKNNNKNNLTNHKTTPVFDCDCFDCYTSYWVRWDSSPNRELIHQAIEAYEDHLTNGELSRKSTRAKRRDKTGRRFGEKPPLVAPGEPEMPLLLGPPTVSSPPSGETHQTPLLLPVVSPDDDVSPTGTPDMGVEEAKEAEEEKLYDEAPETVDETAVVVRTHVAVGNVKGLARKVLPDVLGLLNSRLWGLWSPDV